MAHSHDHDHNHHHHHGPGHHHHHGTGNIAFAFWLNTAFALLEIAGGLYTNSVAILSDALHDLGDSLSLGTAWYFQRKSHQSRDETFTYGYKRFSLLGALVNSVVLTVGSVLILIESVKRFYTPEQPDAKGMMIFAIFGVLANGAAMLRLKKGSSINERVVSLHFLEDVLGWVAVLIGSVVMMFVYIPVLDSLLSLGIAGLILFNVFRNMKYAFRIILQGIPDNTSESSIRDAVLKLDGVKGVHDIHAWSMDGEYNIFTLHVVVTNQTTTQQMEVIKNEVRHRLQHLHAQHITIEMELEDQPCALQDC